MIKVKLVEEEGATRIAVMVKADGEHGHAMDIGLGMHLMEVLQQDMPVNIATPTAKKLLWKALAEYTAARAQMIEETP